VSVDLAALTIARRVQLGRDLRDAEAAEYERRVVK